MNYSKGFPDLDLKNFNSFMVSEENHETVILDSSVIFKWFHLEKEDNLKISQIIYQKTVSKYYLVLAPELLIYEIINIFRFRTDIKPALLKEILGELSSILIFIKLEPGDYISAYEISRKINNSIYDSIYMAISEKYKAQFVTADRKLYQECKPFNYNIVLLDDFIRI